MKYVFGYIQMWKLIAKKHSYMEIGRTLVLFFPWETSIRLFLQFLSLPSPSQGCVDTSLVVREERAFSVCSNASWNFLPLLVLGRMRRRARFSNLPILDSFVVSLTHPSSVHAGGKTIGFHSFSHYFTADGWKEAEERWRVWGQMAEEMRNQPLPFPCWVRPRPRNSQAHRESEAAGILRVPARRPQVFLLREMGGGSQTVELLQTGAADSLPRSPAAGRRLSNSCFSSLAVLSLALEKIEAQLEDFLLTWGP